MEHPAVVVMKVELADINGLVLCRAFRSQSEWQQLPIILFGAGATETERLAAFDAGANDNVGSGYWTHVLSSGQTFYPTESRRTAISAFQMYEVHGSQSGTGIRPGDTIDLDFSVMYALTPRGDSAVDLCARSSRCSDVANALKRAL